MRIDLRRCNNNCSMRLIDMGILYTLRWFVFVFQFMYGCSV